MHDEVATWPNEPDEGKCNDINDASSRPRIDIARCECDCAAMLAINDVTYRIGGRTLLEKATAALPDGARVGLVGRNGAGKTTLFRIIAGEIVPEQGEVRLSARERVGRLAQEAPDGPESLIAVVLAADGERTRL